jgi:chlorobactene glucosyltransferase
MLLYQGIVTVALTLLLLNTLLNLRLLGRPPRTGLPRTEPLVSILVPARNEAHTIARCLVSLVRQDYARCEILVLDDQSDDETAAVVERLARRYPQARLLRGKALPPSWHGKAYACAQLAAAARGEWLLFVDADTVHAPNSVSLALLLAQERHADLVTLLPRLVAGTWGEALLLPTIPLTFLGFLPLGLVTWRRTPFVAGALGQFLLFRRDAYERIGGHKAVRRDIVEDMQLSRLIKQQGGRVAWMDGTSLMRVRMYQGFGAAWRGFTKSAFAAINYSVPILFPGLLACGVLLLGPYVWLVVGIVAHQVTPWTFWLPLLQIGLLWWSYLLVLQRVFLPRRLVWLHAVTILAIFVYTTYSAYQSTRGGGVYWKGRTYRFDRRRTRKTAEHPNPLGWELPAFRMCLAILLVLGGWLEGRALLPFTALAVLGALTCAAVEYASPAEHSPRWTSIADVIWGAGSAITLQLYGLSSLGLFLFAMAVWVIGSRAGSSRTGVLLVGVLFSGVLVLAAATSAPTPALGALLLGWTAVLGFFVGRPLAQGALLRLQRTRSS